MSDARREPAQDEWRLLVEEAIDLLAERKYGNPARSPGHNARLMLQDALAAAPTPPAAEGDAVTLTYTNWRGETAVRSIIPRGVWYGSTEWHPEPQWLLRALDVEKQAERDFALKDFGTPPAAEAPGQEPVAVKPLVWRPHISDPAIQVADVYPFAFCIREVTGFGYWTTEPYTTWNEVHGGLEAARSWVQGLYARIVRAALVPAPPTYADAEAKGVARGIEAAASQQDQKAATAREYAAKPVFSHEKAAFEKLAQDYDMTAAAIRSLASPAPKGGGQ
jgi:hypothetical protein